LKTTPGAVDPVGATQLAQNLKIDDERPRARRKGLAVGQQDHHHRRRHGEGARVQPLKEMEMFFTRMTWVAAFAALVFGVLQILIGVGIAQGIIGPIEDVVSRYSLTSTGAQIDQGVYKILFAIALGTLAEISFAARRI
jgi:hypothetical protein